MKRDYEKEYHNVEDRNWWFTSRRNYIIGLLKDHDKSSKVLDIGCSSGVLLNDLHAIGFDKQKLYGIDISEAAIANCKKNGIENSFVMDAQNISLNEKFDILIASDCLEHLENDTAALDNWYSLLNEGGQLYVFVPAFMSLWSPHDVANMHYRRYTRGELYNKVIKANFKVLKSGYWNFFLFTPVFVYRKINNVLNNNKQAEGDIVHSGIINSILKKLISFENFLLKSVRFPFGISTFCIVKK